MVQSLLPSLGPPPRSNKWEFHDWGPMIKLGVDQKDREAAQAGNQVKAHGRVRLRNNPRSSPSGSGRAPGTCCQATQDLELVVGEMLKAGQALGASQASQNHNLPKPDLWAPAQMNRDCRAPLLPLLPFSCSPSAHLPPPLIPSSLRGCLSAWERG